jgi:hypothetical protein
VDDESKSKHEKAGSVIQFNIQESNSIIINHSQAEQLVDALAEGIKDSSHLQNPDFQAHK